MEIGEEIKSKFKNVQQKAVINIRFTSNWIGNKHNLYMSKFDLSIQQFNILRILRGAKSFLSVNNIKSRMVEKSPNTTRLMDKLIEKELIERIRKDDDRRVVYVKITQKGLDVLSEIDTEFDDLFDFTKNLSDQEAEMLSLLLDKLRG